MAKKTKDEVEKTTIETDEDLSFDDIEEDDDIDDALQALINESVEKVKKQTMVYTDKRIAQVNEKLTKHQELLETHADRITNLEQIVEGMATGKLQAVPVQQQAQAEQKPKNVLDLALGTVGGVAHGVVDTAAFLCESVIDLVTLGRAKRPN